MAISTGAARSSSRASAASWRAWWRRRRRHGPSAAELIALDGWLILDKPLGLGSTQAVSAVKRALRRCGLPKARVGHGGTLDPLATGVLPIAIGEATKLTGRMLDADKAYDFTIAFGTETSTLDAEGEVVATSAERPSRAALEAVLARFTGPIEQVPPAYSALKVAGKRAYDLARAGEAVALASRAVVIHSLSPSPEREGGPAEGWWRGLSTSDAPGGEPPPPSLRDGPPPRPAKELQEITLSARVSKGTYIRSLARDIAYALGTVGHVTMLRRTKAGPFMLDQAVPLDKLEEAATAPALVAIGLPLTAGLDGIPALDVSREQASALQQGRTISGMPTPHGLCLATYGSVPVALVEVAAGEARVVRGFNLMPKD